MWSLLIRLLIVSSMVPAGNVRAGEDTWSLAGGEIMAGGCATIVLGSAAPSVSKLHLEIEGRAPIPLAGVGPVIRGPTETLVLVCYDLHNPGAFEAIEDSEDEYRLVPIFENPGRVRLTLLAGSASLGTKYLDITPVTEEAQSAVRLFYPNIRKNESAGPVEARWMRLLLNSRWEGPAPIPDAQLAEFKVDLPVVASHPDWAAVAKILVAYREKQAVSYGARALESQGAPGGRNVALSSWAERVLAGRTESPFVEAVQRRAATLQGE